MYDHGKVEREASQKEAIMAKKLTISVSNDRDDGFETISYTLTNGHAMPIYRVINRAKTFMEVYAHQLEIGDIVVVLSSDFTYKEGTITELETVFLHLNNCIYF